MTLIELSLILTYVCVLMIKACGISPEACETFGFGRASDGVRASSRRGMHTF